MRLIPVVLAALCAFPAAQAAFAQPALQAADAAQLTQEAPRECIITEQTGSCPFPER